MAEPTKQSAVQGGAWRSPRLTALLLLIVVTVAGGLRFTGIDWDEGAYLHPDERFLAFVTSNLARPASLQEYLDTGRSPLNPNNRGFAFFVYGQLPISVVRYLGDWLDESDSTTERDGDGVGLNASYAAVYLLGRGMSAVCDIGTVLVTFAIGRALYGHPVGLLAAAFYAFAVLPIQQAHFFTVDASAAWWAAVAFWLAIRAGGRARWSDDALFGVALGCGLATKVSVFLVALPFVLAVAQRVIGEWPAANDPSRAPVRKKVALLARAMLSLNIAAITALLCFRLLHPYAFVPTSAGATRPADASVLTLAYDRAVDVLVPQVNPAWLLQMAEVGRMMSGNYDQPPNHQWATRTPLLFPWLNMVRFGFGWLLGLTVWTAWIWALTELVRRRSGAARHLLPVVWVGVYFGWYGTQWVSTMRYFLPVYPTLAVLAAWALLRLFRMVGARPCAPDPSPVHGAEGPAPARLFVSSMQRHVGVVTLPLVLLGTLTWAVAVTSIYTREHPRVAASRWFFANVPEGTTIATEGEWEDAIPVSLDGHDPWGTMYQSRALQMVLPDTPAKREHLQAVLDESEYLVISSNRLYGSLTRNPRRWPMTMEVYRSVFSEQLGFDLVADFASFPRIGPLWIDDSGAEEAFTVYDHPRVFVFKKGAAYRSETTRVILARADLAAVEIRRADQVNDAPMELPIPPPVKATGGSHDGAG